MSELISGVIGAIVGYAFQIFLVYVRIRFGVLTGPASVGSRLARRRGILQPPPQYPFDYWLEKTGQRRIFDGNFSAARTFKYSVKTLEVFPRLSKLEEFVTKKMHLMLAAIFFISIFGGLMIAGDNAIFVAFPVIIMSVVALVTFSFKTSTIVGKIMFMSDEDGCFILFFGNKIPADNCVIKEDGGEQRIVILDPKGDEVFQIIINDLSRMVARILGERLDAERTRANIDEFIRGARSARGGVW